MAIAIAASTLLMAGSLAANAESLSLENTKSGRKYAAKCETQPLSAHRARVCARLLQEARLEFASRQGIDLTQRPAGEFAKRDLPQMERVDAMRRSEMRRNRR